MALVSRVGNVRLVVFPRDHPPPHAHAIGPDWHVTITLGNLDEKPSLLSVKYGEPTRAQVRTALAGVDANSDVLWAVWRELHG